MKISFTTRAAFVLAAAVVSAAGCRPATQDPRDKDHLLERVDRFVDLMVDGDVDALMEFYPDTPDPVVYNPDGEPLVGKEAIRAGWDDFFERFDIASAETSDVRVRVSGELGATYGLWTMNVTVTATDTPLDLSGRFTTVWGKRGGEWYVLHDHISSPLPAASPAGDGEAATES